MTAYVALLRAVNVGGTGKLPMAELKTMCEAVGFDQVKTYIASGNVVFVTGESEAKVRSALEERLHKYAGKAIGVLVRNAAEIARLRDENPFKDKPGNRTVALVTDDTPSLDGATGRADEEMKLGHRAIYVFYPSGQADTKLKIPAAKAGTGRNMNTIAKLAEMAAALQAG